MANARLNRGSSPREANLLLLGVLFSLWGHGCLYGLYLLGLPWLSFAHHPTPAELKRAQELRQAQQRQAEPQLLFVQVDPTQVPTEAPKNTKNYSSQNSIAANVDPQTESDTPKIDGTQTHVPKADETPRTKMFPLQPSAPTETKPPEPAKTPSEEKQKPGDLAMAKPPEPKTETPAPRERPHRLAEVQANPIIGERMKQDGGVKRRRMPSFDAVGTKFGEYDARIIAAITQHWYDLVDNQGVSMDRTGKVVLSFHLNYDGSITDMKVVEFNVSELQSYLCQKAITDPAPYDRWPSEMRRTVGADFREVTFTFYYD
jgi:outer membrane biosynthesis protein TonB